jgi:hypothetical protein
MIHTYETNPLRIFKHPSLIFNSFFWWDLKYQISASFNPRQKWLTKSIPNTWCDKTTLIPHLLFECLIHYVEKEEGLQDQTDWSKDLKEGYVTQEYIDTMKTRDELLRAVYNYVKTERLVIESEQDNSYPIPLSPTKDLFTKNEDGNRTMRTCDDVYGMSFTEAYAEVDRLEKLIEEKDMWAMNTIVKYYQYMWT